MFEIRYKLCKRSTLSYSNKVIYYLAITNKEEVIKELNLHPINIEQINTNSYFLQADVLVDKNKVSGFTKHKTDIKLYKDLNFSEVISMLETFYSLKDGDFSSVSYGISKDELVSIMQLIIARWDDWN